MYPFRTYTYVSLCVLCVSSSSVRALVNAYITAFDRHFNMLLSDVDEEYVTNNQKVITAGSLKRPAQKAYKR
jgi:hypothetical protein